MSSQEILSSAKTLSRKEFDNLLSRLANNYYNTNADADADADAVEDHVWDELVDIFEEKFGEAYVKVGAPVCPIGGLVGLREEHKLPRFMGSLSKIKTQKAIDSWSDKFPGPYVLTDKIDGVSALTNGKEMYTRGDGYTGTNISHLLPHMNIKNIEIDGGFVRGEIVMPRSVFESKYKKDNSNARNMASGIINAKHPDVDKVRDLLFIAYEFMVVSLASMTPMTPLAQLKLLTESGFTIPYYEVKKKLSAEELASLLSDRKRDSDYNMDGIVVVDDHVHPFVNGRNPKYAMAFKIEGSSGETIVEEVKWHVSGHGLLKPTVHLKTINLGGTNISKVTGVNGKMIIDNKIGPGSRVIITRCGDVIPNITKVLSPATSGKGQMPKEPWEWYKREVIAPCTAGTGTADKTEFAEEKGIDESIISIERRGEQDYYVWYRQDKENH
jgi:DNA ligase (NAD+)